MDQKKYKLTTMSVMHWAKHELNHVGRIVSVQDPDIQYSYAMSTLYGMLHLKNALTEMVNDSAYSVQREDLQRTLDQVVRTIKHLIKDFSLDLNAIQAFNTKKVLGDISNFKPANTVVTRVNNTRNRNTRVNAPTNKPTNIRTNVVRNNTRKNTNKGVLGLGFLGL
jgi:hypothetical protein